MTSIIQRAELQAKIRKSNVKIGEMEKVIASLNSQLAQRDSSINTLNLGFVFLSFIHS